MKKVISFWAAVAILATAALTTASDPTADIRQPTAGGLPTACELVCEVNYGNCLLDCIANDPYQNMQLCYFRCSRDRAICLMNCP